MKTSTKAKTPKTAPPVAPGVDLGIVPAGAHPWRLADVPLAQLQLHPDNPRAGAPPEDVDALAATIAAVGLLQPLIGTAEEGGGVWVLDGRRRLAALHALGRAAPATVPVHLLPPGASPSAAALAANVQRVALSPAQEARAYAAASASNPAADPVAAVARAFGVSERHVRQRLALAGLAPPVFAALEAGQLSLDAARAYARAAPHRQEAVFADLPTSARDWQIRAALDKGGLKSHEPAAVLVGEVDYLAAGGEIERDLFSDAGAAVWLDAALAYRLADERLAAVARVVLEEGWALVEVAPANPDTRWASDLGAHTPGKPRAPTDAEAALIADAQAEQLRAREALDQLEAQDDAPVDYDAWDRADDAWDRADDALTAANAALDALQAGLQTWPDKQKAKLAARVRLGGDGYVRVERGLALQARSQPAPGKAGAGGDDGPDGPDGEDAAPDVAPEWTQAGLEQLFSAAAHAASAAFARAPTVALAAVVAALWRALEGDCWPDAPLDPDARYVPPQLALAPTGQRTNPAIYDHPAAHALRQRLAPLTHPTAAPAALETELAGWAVAALLEALALLTAALVTSRLHSPAARARLGALAAAAGCDPGAAWTPDLALMKSASAPALRAYAAELGLDPPAGAKKAELAALVADAAAGAGWTPPLVREACGVAWTPPQPGAPAAPEKGKARGKRQPRTRGTK